MTRKITPENITELTKNQVFVFGSNESGIHGAGAALVAKEKFGAQEGVGYGHTGQCFAIPTKGWKLVGTLPILVIECFVARFAEYVMMNPHKEFLITKIGCGLAGYKPKDIAPLFSVFTVFNNVSLPKEFWDIIDDTFDEELIKSMEILDNGTSNELSDI